MTGNSKLLMVAFCILSNTSYSQFKSELKTERENLFLKYTYFKTNSFYNTEKIASNQLYSSSVVPVSFQTSNLAFFCRQELRFEKATTIPFKFRLGSFNHVNFLEGKNQMEK